MKHKAIINGAVKKKEYYFGQSYDNPYGWGVGSREVRSRLDFVKESPLWEGELELPLLEEGEKVYIEELDVTVEIEGRLRTTKGITVYTTSYVVEVIEDVSTFLSKKKAEVEQAEYLEWIKEKEETDKEFENAERPKYKKKWLQRIFNK